MSKPFWDKKWGKDNRCAITCSRLRPGQDKNGLSYTIELECGHRFWRKALVRWCVESSVNINIGEHVKCPVCRADINILK